MSLGKLVDQVGDLSRLVAREDDEPLVRYDLSGVERVTTAADIVRLAATAGGVTHVAAVHGSAPALLARELANVGKRAILVVDDTTVAEELARDLSFFLGPAAAPVLSLVPAESTPWADVNPDRRGAQLRLATLSRLARGEPWSALVMTAGALVRKVVPRSLLDATSFELREGDEIDRDEIARRLVEAGYARSPVVEDPASFAMRGGLVDLWPIESSKPLRIELYGDMVLSIRPFDPEGQRTAPAANKEGKPANIPSIHVALARETPLDGRSTALARERLQALCDALEIPSSKARSLAQDVATGRAFFGADGFVPAFGDLAPVAEYLPKDAVVVLVDPPAIVRAVRDELGRAVADVGARRGEPHFPLEAFYTSEAEVTARLGASSVLAAHRAATVGNGDATTLERFELTPTEAPTLHTFDQAELRRAIAARRLEKGKSSALGPLVRQLRHFADEGYASIVVARARTQVERVAALLSHKGLAFDVELEGVDPLDKTLGGRVVLACGDLARGLVAPASRLALVTEEDIFGARAARRASARKGGASGTKKARAFVEDLKTLSVGDYVVHVEHGVGRYLGLVHKDVGTTRVDLISIEYAGGDRLYLPVYRLNQIEKLSGADGTPKLDRLGGSTFQKTKDRAKREVRQMADELLKLYAERRALTRDPLPPPDDDLRAFEATFPFDETPDQATAIVDVEGDLSGPYPMDRLVCGDVGFGKTEVAIRAAFRVASAGRQVAVLCPTTVLAQQHFLAFQQRFAGYPINVRNLSRFTSPSAARETLAGLKSGSVDVVVGTHRLLSKDVHWKRLGLVVIDEEQRFGVAHKERMKHLRTSVDVLTLSATPIPRTLQMAVSSLRDMSIITTPPVDRRAIRTVISKHDEAVIRDAIVRELDRGGQVFYVYNRVEGLYERAARLAELVPTARIAVGHGQLSDGALEQAMIDFVEGRYDILCATAIIESGLDIPRANTMIIDRADMFGLSQLYQLRGRVGRSRERAVCYLLVPPQNAMTDESRSRIEALERHTDLGSGFHVASLDLEIRGAGDLLGADQSGVVTSVGFDLFTRMLDEAVAELSGETVVREIDTDVSIDEEALLPEDYIDDVGSRLSLYKRFASSESVDEVNDVAVEMEDRFGPAPEAARRLVRMMSLKVELRRLRVLGCDASKSRVNLHMSEDAPVDTAKLLAIVQAKKSPFKLSPDMRLTRRFAEGEVKGALEAIDQTLRDLAGCFRAPV